MTNVKKNVQGSDLLFINIIMTDLINKLRKPKLGGIAIFDVGGSVVVALLIAQRYEISKLKTIIGILALGELVHVAFGIQTAVTRKIFNNRLHVNQNNNTNSTSIS